MFCFRLKASEPVQYFQFDSDGNMYIFPPGSGCTGEPTLVKPGDELFYTKLFNYDTQKYVKSEQCVSPTEILSDGIAVCSQQSQMLLR